MIANRNEERYNFVPKALWGKFPNTWILMLEKSTRMALEISHLILAFMILYATLLGPPHKSEWVYLLTACLGRLQLLFWYIVFPLNPYRCAAAIRERMKDKDKTDPDAKELVLLLKSPKAHRFLLNRAWKLSLLFVVPMAIISFTMHRIPTWRIGADSLVRIPAFFFLSLFLLFRIEMLAWAIRNWEEFNLKCRCVQPAPDEQKS